jgi:hypothetical protein
MEGWWREIGGMLQGTGTTGRSFKRRPWLRMGCCANDDDDESAQIAITLKPIIFTPSFTEVALFSHVCVLH